MSRAARVAFALLLSCAAISPASAAIFVFTGTLSGDQERPVPVTLSEGTGTVTVTWDDVAHTMFVEAVFDDLFGRTTASHIHVSPEGQDFGGVATQTPSFTGFPLGVKSGSFSNTFDMTLASSFSAGFITLSGGTVELAEAALLDALLDGRAYFNIHTHEFPGGEIRANLTQVSQVVPEPATWMMMLGGFAAVGLAFRRRRAKEPVPA